MINPFRPVAISLIPNFRFGEVWAAWGELLTPWKYFDEGPGHVLEKKLGQYLGRKFVVLFESGRAAEYFLLTGLGIGEGDEVIIQAFTCVAVPNSIIWAGARPVYVDVDATGNLDAGLLEKAITARTKAVIVQHTFGMPCNLDEIRRICKKRKILLLEDCAHGLGNEFEGEKLGSFGEAAFFSFGRDKVISGIWGGAVVTDDEKLALELQNISGRLPKRQWWWVAKQLAYPVLMHMVLNLYSLMGVGKAAHFLLRRVKLLPDVLSLDEKRGARPAAFYRGMAGGLARSVLRQLAGVDQFVAHRRKLAKYYSDQLNVAYDLRSSYLRFGMETEDPGGLRRFAARKNIFLGDWYDWVVAPRGVDLEKVGYEMGSCPKAEALGKRIVNLPTNPNMGLEEAEKVVEVVCEWIKVGKTKLAGPDSLRP